MTDEVNHSFNLHSNHQFPGNDPLLITWIVKLYKTIHLPSIWHHDGDDLQVHNELVVWSQQKAQSYVAISDNDSWSVGNSPDTTQLVKVHFSFTFPLIWKSNELWKRDTCMCAKFLNGIDLWNRTRCMRSFVNLGLCVCFIHESAQFNASGPSAATSDR